MAYQVSPQIRGLVEYHTGGLPDFKQLQEAVKRIFDDYSQSVSPKHGRRRMSDVLEAGTEFQPTECGNGGNFVYNDHRDDGDVHRAEWMVVEGFVATQTAAHRRAVARLVGCTYIAENDQNVNIVLRRYRKGQGIGFHIDRRDKLDEMVFTVVVHCGCGGGWGGGLQFEREDHLVCINETPGLVVVQTGDARNRYKHGVPRVLDERISLTWRWFRPAYIANKFPFPRMKSFVDAVRRTEISIERADDARTIQKLRLEIDALNESIKNASAVVLESVTQMSQAQEEAARRAAENADLRHCIETTMGPFRCDLSTALAQLGCDAPEKLMELNTLLVTDVP